RTIKRKGVVDALENMGINDGDTVKVHDFEFEYFR
ncbi:MAG: Obg family GTPase CgtA, partial [Bacteroidales bacterium]|nr:Obg family GTPase CgtA [Bacteroidales bacterium]